MRLALVVALGALTLACSAAPPLPPREPAPAPALASPPPDQRAHIAAVEHGLLPPVRVRGREQRRDLLDRMRAYHVPGLSIAVIGDHRVLWAQAYGVADVETGQPMRETTLLQAGSISKPLTALAALEAVEQGPLGLDTPINEHLQDWKIPDSPFTEKATVSLRRLLSHSGGTTVHGFRGYRAEDPLPSLVQILDGKPPANTPPVRVHRLPGHLNRYSGGGLTIVQLALVEQFHRPFPALLHDLVLAPLGMERSTFAQPLPPALLADAAAGHDREGKLIPGKRMIYPEMAAAGLWTTPTDLGRFFAEIELGVEGKSKQITKKLADLMTTQEAIVGTETAGLGLFLHDEGDARYFGHTGINAGFHSMATMRLGGGYGAVMMANGELGMLLFEEIKRAIAVEYGWEGVAPPIDPVVLSDEKLVALSGRFATGLIRPFVLSPKKGSLIMERPLEPPVELVPVGDETFVALDDGTRCHVVPAEVECAGKSGREKATRLAEGARPPLMLIAAGDHDGALAALRALQQADPQSPAVSEERLDTLGSDLFFRRQDREHGLLVLRLATELRPDAIRAYVTLAHAYEAIADKQKAIETYRAGIAALARDQTMTEARKKEITQAAERQIDSLKRP